MTGVGDPHRIHHPSIPLSPLSPSPIFSNRLKKLEKIGLKVKILDENELIKLGMNALLGVGQGSPSPSKVVIMEWNGGGRSKPLALAGKGVVFDTGGISIKPANGMEEMTVDMAGAGVVAGVMKTLAMAGISGGKDMMKWSDKNSLMRRNITLDDVGKSGLYLLSSLSSGVTGEVHYVDCGYNVVGVPREI